MTFACEEIIESESAVRLAESIGDLSSIHERDCAAAIWDRQPTASFQSWINGLESDQLPQARVILRPQNVRNAVSEICKASNTPEGQECDRLIDDVAELAQAFAGLMRVNWLRLRFDVITTNACQKFHIDEVTARLVCTYRGTGTQYGFSYDGAEPTSIFTTPTYAPIVLRGRLWPGQTQASLLHKSPQIEGTGETRLMLVLDPVQNPDEEPDRIML